MAFALNDDKSNRTDADKLWDLQRNCREGSLKYLEDFYCQDHLASQYFHMPLPGPKGYTLLHEAVEVRDGFASGHLCKIKARTHTPPPPRTGVCAEWATHYKCANADAPELSLNDEQTSCGVPK